MNTELQLKPEQKNGKCVICKHLFVHGWKETDTYKDDDERVHEA